MNNTAPDNNTTKQQWYIASFIIGIAVLVVGNGVYSSHKENKEARIKAEAKAALEAEMQAWPEPSIVAESFSVTADGKRMVHITTENADTLHVYGSDYPITNDYYEVILNATEYDATGSLQLALSNKYKRAEGIRTYSFTDVKEREYIFVPQKEYKAEDVLEYIKKRHYAEFDELFDVEEVRDFIGLLHFYYYVNTRDGNVPVPQQKLIEEVRTVLRRNASAIETFSESKSSEAWTKEYADNCTSKPECEDWKEEVYSRFMATVSSPAELHRSIVKPFLTEYRSKAQEGQRLMDE